MVPLIAYRRIMNQDESVTLITLNINYTHDSYRIMVQHVL